jgi:hypothetical protein
VTFVFVKHRHDGKYEIRFRAREREDYRRMLMSLYAYVPRNMHEFDSKARTWVVEGKCQREIERWLARMIEELNPSVEFFCEREEAWNEAVSESYRILHLLPSAPWEVVQGTYNILIDICRDPGQRARVDEAYERLRKELKKDDSSERGS